MTRGRAVADQRLFPLPHVEIEFVFTKNFQAKSFNFCEFLNEISSAFADMSRLIVKNLPKNITEDRMKTIFGEMGQITDLKLKFTKRGVFRRFAFVGFKTHTEAERALKQFNDTFIDTSKIQVDICKDLGDETAPRPWSKYSEKSSAFQKKAQKEERRKRELEGKTDDGKSEEVVKKKKKGSDVLAELENDSSFKEFLEVHKSGSQKNIWSNDGQVEQLLIKEEKYVEKKVCNYINYIELHAVHQFLVLL